MKKHLFTILAILLLIIGCDTQSISKGEICVNINSRSIDPISMETEYYKVSVTSDLNIQSAPRVDKNESSVRFNVEPGTWTVKVDAYNAQDDLIGTGSKDISVSGGSAVQCSIEIKEIEGEGTFSFYYTYDPSSSFNPGDRKIKAILSPVDESSSATVFEGKVSDYSSKINQYKVNNGYYSFELYELCNDSSYKLIYTDEVRIVADSVSSLNGRLYVNTVPGDSFFTKEESNISQTKYGKIHILIDNKTAPIDSNIRASIEFENDEDNIGSVAWYINDVFADYGSTLSYNLFSRAKAGDVIKLSAIANISEPGKYYEYYEDYCYITITDAVGFPRSMSIQRKKEDGKIDLTYGYNDEKAEIICRNNDETSYNEMNGDWYINGELKVEDSSTLTIDDLKPYLGNNTIEFVYWIGDDCISQENSLTVIPDISKIDVIIDNLYAGRKCEFDFKVISVPELTFNKNIAHLLLVDENGQNHYVGNSNPYLPESGTYKIMFCYYDENPVWLNYLTGQEIKITDPTEKEILVSPSNTIMKGGYAKFEIPYVINNVEEVAWFLDGKEIKTSIYGYNSDLGFDEISGTSRNWQCDNIEWPVGEHELKAVNGDDIYKTTIHVYETPVEFIAKWRVDNKGKRYIQFVPKDIDYSGNYTTEYNTGSTIHCLSGDEWVEYDTMYSKNEFIVSYEYDGKDYKFYGYCNPDFDYVSINASVSFDKYLYTTEDYIIVNVNVSDPDAEYQFFLDEQEIDINFDGNDEYLLPRIKELGTHSFSIIDPNDEEILCSRVFVVSEEGFAPDTPIEVYERLSLDMVDYVVEGNKVQAPDISYVSLIFYEDYYVMYGASYPQGMIVDGGEYEKSKDSTTYVLQSSISENKSYTLTKNEEDKTLVEKSGDDIINEYKQINDPNCTREGIYGSWEFSEIRPTTSLLNALLTTFIPSNEKIPFENLVWFNEGDENTKPEGIGLKLQFEIDDDWITAYIDLDLDVSAFDNQISFVPGVGLHLSGKVEYEETDGYLSILGNGLPIYIQPSIDNSVLLIHYMVDNGNGEMNSFAIPLKRSEAIDNPLDVIETTLTDTTFKETTNLTMDSVFDFISETADLVSLPAGDDETISVKQVIPEMFMGNPVRLLNKAGEMTKDYTIPCGKWSVSTITMDELKTVPGYQEGFEESFEPFFEEESYADFCSVFGDTLYVLMNELYFVNGSNKLCCRGTDKSDGNAIVFEAREEYGVSEITVKPLNYITNNTFYVEIEYHKYAVPVKKGYLKLSLETEGSDISCLYDFLKDMAEMGLNVNSDSIFAEFNEDGEVWYKAGNNSYKVAEYILADDSIILKTDSATILDLIPNLDISTDGWGLEVGLILPYDRENNKVLIFEKPAISVVEEDVLALSLS